MTTTTDPLAHHRSAGRRRPPAGAGRGPGTIGCTVSAFVICLVVIGAVIAVVARAVDHDQPATEQTEAERVPEPSGAPGPDATPRRPPAWTTGAAEVPVGQRVRSGVLLALLVTALGTLGAILIGVLVVALVTAVRTAIG